MENLSNNKHLNISNSHNWLLLIFLICTQLGKAQQVFNKVYTLNGSNTSFKAVATLGNRGSFIAVSLVTDSITKQQETKIVRCNPLGEIQMAQNLRHPEFPYKKIYIISNSLKQIHDNLYALVAARWVNGVQFGSCVITIDSNGTLQHIQDILEPVPTAPDTLSYINSLIYDEHGYLFIAGNDGSAYLDSNKNILMKYDTSLNLVWKKKYRVSGILSNRVTYGLTQKNSKIFLCGGAWDFYSPWSDSNFKEQSLIIATDTAGVELWHYASPVTKMYDCESAIKCGIATTDGGYLYITMGNVYDFYPKGPATAPMGMLKLIKLDALRNKIWEKELEKYNHSFGTVIERMMELEDSSIIIAHSYSTDSISDEGYYYTNYLFSRYRADGSLLYHRKLTVPKDVGDTSLIFSGWGAFDICRMHDKGFLLAGSYSNGSLGSIGYGTHKAWLIRLDSNGFLAAGDTGSMAVGIKPISFVNSAISIYPNPSDGAFTISSRNPSFVGIKVGATIYDLLGRVVHQQNLSFNNKEAVLKLHLPSATYILELSDKEGKVQRERIVIQ